MLFQNERKEADNAGELDLASNFTLVSRAQTAALASNDLTERREEALEHLGVLVVDSDLFVHAEIAVTLFLSCRCHRLERDVFELDLFFRRS